MTNAGFYVIYDHPVSLNDDASLVQKLEKLYSKNECFELDKSKLFKNLFSYRCYVDRLIGNRVSRLALRSISLQYFFLQILKQKLDYQESNFQIESKLEIS